MTIGTADVEMYAAMSRDFNAIHVDAAFAAASEFGRPIAHGTIPAAFLLRSVNAATPEGIRLEKCQVKYVGVTPVGDDITVSFQELEAFASKARATLIDEGHLFTCQRSDGTPVVAAYCSFVSDDR